MTAKNGILLSVLLLFSMLSQAQTIEVIVEEMVSLKPVDYSYVVTFDSPDNDVWEGLDLDEEEEYNEEEGEDLTLDEPDLEEIEAVLEQQKFKFTRVEGESSLFGNSSEALRVAVDSERELKRLETLLEAYDNISGFVESANFEPVSNHHAALYPKMLEAAKKEAGIIASSAQRSLGMILSVEELGKTEDPFSSLMGMYGNLFRKMGMNKELGLDATVRTVEVKLLVRFELK
ncbi:MAG: hypothetical protein A3D92_00715 [Bacteroidetes bacterium RIFCSPHIGHO2_02_FULL_44_7]|nr:MAG: hypothetical protein A3D92_00715 [Bacteroidetes bacterium RIFCSPHIGHO2_02_FULL_44_7]